MHSSKKYNIVSLTVLLSFLFLFHNLLAQDAIDYKVENEPSFKERLFYGGSLGLQFGSNTLIDIAPMIGYKFTNKIGLAISPTYKYYSYKNYYTSDNSDLKTNVIGGSIFCRIIIYGNIFAHAEYEYLTFLIKDKQLSNETIAKDFQSFLIGGGYREPISENAYMYILALWNLNETLDSPYNNPVIRVGFSIGF